MLRIIAEESDIGAAANVGGPVIVRHKTFDVNAPEVERYLSLKQQWATRQIIGVEYRDEAAEEPGDLCEGCNAPAVTTDSEGVPLCQKCADELAKESEVTL
jgi:hypothetical protein